MLCLERRRKTCCEITSLRDEALFKILNVLSAASDTQSNAAISYAMKILECDTKFMTSPLRKGYL